MKKGFTLIELLIVVAIIAILAAIAVPNFLEAQTRSKVSRVLSDMRTIGVGIESYATDHRAYPPSTWAELGQSPPPGQDAWFFGARPDLRLKTLTSPIAYLSRPPQASPFKPPINGDSWANYYQYSTRKGMILMNNNDYLNALYNLAAGRPVQLPTFTPRNEEGPGWVIMDTGPDGVFFFDLSLGWSYPPALGWVDGTIFYDPTNGTVSYGDIVRSQMKSSFQ
jgi:prepilin-type N-terminal cleavage/methylation domain-containing protein